jgi:8-oxo-dGTP pyrophosphatase MutT (NUDIX family)
MKEIETLARGVLLDGEYVLLARCKGSAVTFLPGGHVHPGEGLVAALKRELREELDISCRVGPYLGAVEHSFTEEDGRHFEINHYFRVQGQGLKRSFDPISREEQLEFHWVHQRDLERRHLMPGPVREMVRRLIRGYDDIWWGTTLSQG